MMAIPPPSSFSSACITSLAISLIELGALSIGSWSSAKRHKSIEMERSYEYE